MAMIEAVHGVVEVFEGGLPFVFAPSPPVLVDAVDAAAQDAEHEQAVGVAHPAGIFTRGDVEALVQSAFDPPILTDGGQQWCGSFRRHFQAAEVEDGFLRALAFVFAGKDRDFARDLHHGAGSHAAEAFSFAGHPAQAALFAPGAVALLGGGGSARGRGLGWA